MDPFSRSIASAVYFMMSERNLTKQSKALGIARIVSVAATEGSFLSVGHHARTALRGLFASKYKRKGDRARRCGADSPASLHNLGLEGGLPSQGMLPTSCVRNPATSAYRATFENRIRTR